MAWQAGGGLREGVSHDGGLLVPTSFPICVHGCQRAGLSFPNLALEMARVWMGKEWHEEFLEEVFSMMPLQAIRRADPASAQGRGSNGVHILELFHGPSGGAGQHHAARSRAQPHRAQAKGRATVVTGFTNALEALSIANACKEALPLSSFFAAPLISNHHPRSRPCARCKQD